jgi:septum site-determining protein MinD
VTLNNPQSPPARAYADAARRLMGEAVPMTVQAERRSFLDKFFARRAA